jgi:signal transduction histidine kinase
MRKKILVIALLILLGNITLGYFVYQNNQNRIESVKLVQHTVEVSNETAKIYSVAGQIKTLLNSYKNNRDTGLFSPIEIERSKIAQNAKQLIFLTQDNPLQHSRAKLLAIHINYFIKIPFNTDSRNIENLTSQIAQVVYLILNEEDRLLIVRKGMYKQNLIAFNFFNIPIFGLMITFTFLLLIATHKINRQNAENDQSSLKLKLANGVLFFENSQKRKRADELALANIELLFQNEEKEHRAAELVLANIELSFQSKEKERRAQELILANLELVHQNKEKEKRAQELGIANIELSFQNTEKEKRASELKVTMLQLNKSESSLKEAQAISHVGNFEINLINKAEIWSDEMYSILGLDKASTIPSIIQFLKYIHPNDAQFMQQAIDDSFNNYQLTSIEFRFHKTDGSLRYGYSESQFELDENGKPLRMFGIFQDITNTKLAELERNKMMKELIQRNKDLEQFAYIISHNLRAPVANILGASTILNDPEISVDDATILNSSINQSVIKLDSVIKDLNHILDIKTITDEQQEVVCFSDLVLDIKHNIQRQINKKDIIIDFNFSVVDHITTLKHYLHSIFYNLIINSVKYRKSENPILIKISSRKIINGIELRFSDNGLGIDLNKNGEEIFGLYKRFHQHIEGKGMGLFMVKTHVEALGGNIDVFSTTKGTTFKIKLIS